MEGEAGAVGCDALFQLFLCDVFQFSLLLEEREGLGEILLGYEPQPTEPAHLGSDVVQLLRQPSALVLH